MWRTPHTHWTYDIVNFDQEGIVIASVPRHTASERAEAYEVLFNSSCRGPLIECAVQSRANARSCSQSRRLPADTAPRRLAPK
jgi:hypothetical protein